MNSDGAMKQANARERRPTIRDAALKAGVSISTVSRVMTGAVAVDPVTAGRVRAAVDAIGYRPDLLARSFRKRVTHTIGLLLPDNSNPFFAEIARAIEDAGFEQDYSVILCNSDLSRVKQEAYVDVLLAKRVDGLILVSSGLIPSADNQDAVSRILDAGAPCVVVDRDLGEAAIDQVLVDNHLGGYLAGEHLVRLGHREIACIVGPSDLTPSAGRIAGFRGALTDAGLDIHPGALVRGDGRYEGGVLAARDLIERGVPFSAVFAFNDQMATGAVAAFQRQGLRLPEDVSVVGFDDIPRASAMFPALTTVAQPIAEMGVLGVQLLLNRIARPDAPFERIQLPTRLVIRESTGPPGGWGQRARGSP